MNRSLRRKLSYGSNATLVTLLVVTLVVILYAVADRHRARWDLSEEGANKLQQDTLNKVRLLQDAGEVVSITAFSSQEGKPETPVKNRQIRDLLEELDARSTLLKTRFIDFDRERLTAEAMNVSMYGTVVVQRGDRRVDIRDRDLFRRRGTKDQPEMEFLGESALNQAFSQIMSDQRRVIYSLMGHGELDIENKESGGISELVTLLDQEHYELKALDLVRERSGDGPPKVPDGCAALLLARPRTTLTAAENDAILEYLSEGGRILTLVDVGLPTPRLLAPLGLSVSEGYVMDERRVFPYEDRPVPVFRNHVITMDLAASNLTMVMAHVAPLKWAEPGPGGVRYSELLRTSRQGWIERGGPDEKGVAVANMDIDTEGPVDMAVAMDIEPGQGLVIKGQPPARVVVIGDSDFVTNGILAEGPANATFLVNTLRWLVGDDERLSVVGKPTSVRRLALTAEDTSMIRWVALGLGPLCVLMVGAAVWTVRRGR